MTKIGCWKKQHDYVHAFYHGVSLVCFIWNATSQACIITTYRPSQSYVTTCYHINVMESYQIWIGPLI